MNFDEFLSKYQKTPVVEYKNSVSEECPRPIVSCRVITYQHKEYIGKCLDGILMQQTDFPFEVVVGEDDSNDGTREICKEYADKHPNKIRLFLNSRENNIQVEGKPSAHFQSIYTVKQCRGEFVAYCEGDDYWIDPLKLQRQVNFMRRHLDVSACGHHCVHITKNFSKLHRPFEENRFFDKIDLYFDQIITTSTVMYKKFEFTEYPFAYSCEYYGGDKLSWLFHASRGRLAFLSDIMAVHFETGKGMGTGLDPKERARLVPIKRKITREVYPYTTWEILRAYGRKIRRILLTTLEIPRHPLLAGKDIILQTLRLSRAFRQGFRLGFR
ncbi:MAG: glycosyltransferase [Kiritimatiellae bacterium]|jgi:glycosyltransferase involved in cell wall biosynthesis|nr:glycosyltransferase [Kiritimatiellia bacterium]